MNIRFSYLYRDAGNFKQWGDIVLSNPNNMDTNLATLMAEQVLIDKTYFVANKAEVPDLHFIDYIKEADHGWHEFDAFSLDIPNDPKNRNIQDFIESLRSASTIKASDMQKSDIPIIFEGIDIIIETAAKIWPDVIVKNKADKLV